MIPIVLHIPHASRNIPATERRLMLIDDADLEYEVLSLTDAWTDELVQLAPESECQRVVAPVSRLVCDVERFRDDQQEPMSDVGMGAVYVRTISGRPCKN